MASGAPRTSTPKSNVSHDWFPLRVVPRASRLSGCQTRLSALRTAPTASLTVRGYTTLDFGAYMNSVHGPTGADANAGEHMKSILHSSKEINMRCGENMTSFGSCAVELIFEVNLASKAFSHLASMLYMTLYVLKSRIFCKISSNLPTSEVIRQRSQVTWRTGKYM